MKKLYLSVLYVVLLSLLIGGAILFSKPGTGVRSLNNSAAQSGADRNVNAYKNHVPDSAALIRQENINIFNNESSLDLHASLVENENGQVTLNLAYKLDDRLITKSIDASNVTEIRNIFRFRDKYGSGYKINNMLLNHKKDMVFFCVEGRKEKKYFYLTVYSYDLKNSKLEKLYHGLGAFGEFFISPDGKYNAFTYLNCPQNISFNEKNSVVIINCSDNRLILDTSPGLRGNAGDTGVDLLVYSYEFIKWKGGTVCELREKIKSKDGSSAEREKKLYYDAVSGKFSEEV